MTETGQMLLTENIRSVGHRYEDSEITELPGRVDCEYMIPYRYRVPARVPTAVETIKLVHCYRYQTCEHPGWEQSDAHGFCDALEAAAIDALPGYGEAPWRWAERT